MADYQPFPITAMKTGLFNYLQPWIRPEEAFEPLENAQVYRGVLSKRNGSVQLGNQLADHNPVMGIMNYVNESTGAASLVVSSTRNAYLYDAGGNVFNALTAVVDSNFWQGNIPGGLTITVPTFWPNITPLTTTITDGTSTITFNAGGAQVAPAGNFAAGGSIVLATGVVTLNFVAPSTNQSLSINITNFFNWTNWQPTDPTTFVSSTSFLYMTNDVDPITLFDGTNLSRPIYYVDSAHTDYIKTTFDVKVYQNRLLAIRPTLNSTSNPVNQSIFWSAIYNPSNFIADVAGNGGQLSAATSDIIQSFNFLRDVSIVRFTKSTWTFRYTGNDFNPFQFAKINSSKSTNCPYASIEYDERETGIGNTGITATDGVNLQRFDVPIIDFYETEMSEKFYRQAFSERYDNNSETWTFYVSQSNAFSLVGGVAPGSDKALIYNFIENTWATYIFSRPMTCLGSFYVVSGATWASLNVVGEDEWEHQDSPWFSYSSQATSPQLLAGDTTGHVYWMDNEDYDDDNGNVIPFQVTSTRWNPFIQAGQKVQFGYIDFYYTRNPDCTLTLDFSIDNSGNVDATRSLTLDGAGNDGTAGSTYAMKRVYINAMGEFLRMNMKTSSQATFQILGLVLWARPAGRLTP
jgi:hypothetical protein